MDSVRLKFICRLGYGDALPKDDEETDGDIPVFGSNGQYTTTATRNTKEPAIVVGRKGSYGKVNWASDGCFASDTTFFIDSRFTNSNLRWLYWTLQTLSLDEGSQEAAVPGLNRDSVYKQRIFLPEYEDQRLIANYLDRETAHIDALVAEKEKMLALLEEKRAALISRAVTRGLNPDAPLKPSGLDWLGDFPVHWETMRLGFLVSLQGGLTPATSKEDFWGGSIPWASPKDIKKPVLLDTVDHVSEDALLITGLSLIEPPVVLLVVRGMILAKAVPTSLTAVPMTINQDMKALRPLNGRLDAEYLKMAFDGLQKPLSTLIEESAHGTRCLRTDLLTTFKIPLPPPDEQRRIIKKIRIEENELSPLVENLKNSIMLLKERRTALITAAVTGLIPVEEMHS
jgi:type I restriction enzyme, S subunit